MTLFDQLLQCADTWLDRLDRERDVVTRLLHHEGSKPHLLEWLDSLDVERVKHLGLIAQLQDLQRANHPALLFKDRPPATSEKKRERSRVHAS